VTPHPTVINSEERLKDLCIYVILGKDGVGILGLGWFVPSGEDMVRISVLMPTQADLRLDKFADTEFSLHVHKTFESSKTSVILSGLKLVAEDDVLAIRRSSSLDVASANQVRELLLQTKYRDVSVASSEDFLDEPSDALEGASSQM